MGILGFGIKMKSAKVENHEENKEIQMNRMELGA